MQGSYHAVELCSVAIVLRGTMHIWRPFTSLLLSALLLLRLSELRHPIVASAAAYLSLPCACIFICCNVGMWVLHGESSKYLAPPRNTKGTERLQSTQMTTKRHNSQTKHQAPSKGQPKSRITPTSTEAMHASITPIACNNNAHPSRSSPRPLGGRSPARSTGGLSRTTTKTPPATAGTRCAPRLGGPLLAGTCGQPRTRGMWVYSGSQSPGSHIPPLQRSSTAGVILWARTEIRNPGNSGPNKATQRSSRTHMSKGLKTLMSTLRS